MSPARILPLAAVVAALALAGCGGSDSDSSADPTATSTPAAASGGGQDLEIDAEEPDGKLAFSESTLSAKAGKVTITMANPSGDKQPHAVSIEGSGVDEDGQVVQPGGTSTVTADLKPGTYTFYCPVPGHEDAGMKGTLTVK